jgi:hypothetical protein
MESKFKKYVELKNIEIVDKIADKYAEDFGNFLIAKALGVKKYSIKPCELIEFKKINK